MPRKPEDPRPSRRYNPEADLPLDRLKSASAVVAPPGFAALAPFSLAALFAEPGPGSSSLSFQVITHPSAPGAHAAGSGVEQTAGFPARGGSREGEAPSEPLPTGGSPGGSPSRGTAQPSDNAAFLSHTDTDTSSGGGALPGRGGSGIPSGGARSWAANAQPVRGSGGAAPFFGASVGGPAGGAPSSPPVNLAQSGNGTAGAGQTSSAPPGIASPTPTSTAAGSTAPTASSVATSVSDATQSSTGRAGHPTVQNFGPQSPTGTSNGLTASSSLSLSSLSFASLTFSPTPSSTGSSAPSGGQTNGGNSGRAGGVSPADDGGGIEVMPVGGGDGGIYAQVWRLHPATPYDAPYGGGGPANQSSDGAPFQTLNSLILSYIDQALASIVPANTSGRNVATNPASLSVTAFDGLGTFTFSATANYDIDGQYIHGSFSTTDSATLIYSFHEVGYTPDGNLFTLNDQGGGTLNIHADNGNTLTHSLTNTLIGSDSYALTQVLVQGDTITGAYTSAESTTDSAGGSDNFTMVETQTETVNGSGSITGGADSYVYNETGTDTSSLSDQGNETVASGGVADAGTSSSAGSGSGGHTDHVTGTDTMGAGGFLPQGTNSFTWSGSDSENETTTATDSDGVTVSGDGQAESVTTTETTSDSASDGETGSEGYTNSEGTTYSWSECVSYVNNSQDKGWDQGTETGGEADVNLDGADAGGSGETFSSTETDNGQGTVTQWLVNTGSQSLTNGLIGGGSSTFNWQEDEAQLNTDVESGTESSSGSESGSEVNGGDSSSYFQSESGDDASTATTTDDVVVQISIDGGTETIGSYGLVLGGSENVATIEGVVFGTWNEYPSIFCTEQDSGGDTITQIATETDAASGGLVTNYTSSVETDQDTSGSSELSIPVSQPRGTRTLGAGGLILAYSLTDYPFSCDTLTTSETDTAEVSGTEFDLGPGSTDTDSYSSSESDVASTTETDLDLHATEIEQGSTTIGAGGTVLGGYESTSLTQPLIEDYVTSTETDAEIDADSSTGTTSEGGDWESTSLTSNESTTDNSSETASDTATETDTSSLTMGAAGVVLSGNEYSFETDSGSFTENDTDTGSGSSQEVDDSTGDVGGNTTSDSLSTSETDTSSDANNDGGTEWSTTTENTGYGPGGIVTGGNEGDSSTDIDSPTETTTDTSSGSNASNASDAQAEAADSVSDAPDTTGTDSGTVNETDSDLVTADEQDGQVLGAADNILSGFSSSTESDTGSDQTTDRETSTETTTEADSSSETVGGESATDQATDTSTETDHSTDTENDAPTDWSGSSATYGAAGIVLSGWSSTSLSDVVTDGETDSDVEQDTSTETDSDADGGSSMSSLQDHETETSTASSTDTATDASTDTEYDSSSQSLGLAGVIVGGDDQDIETGTDTSSGGTTAGIAETYTATESDAESDTGDSSNDSTSEVVSDTISSTDPSASGSAFSESMTDTLGAGGVVIGGGLTQTYSDSSGTSLSISGTLTTTTTLTDSTTETDSITENFNDTSIDDSGDSPDVGDEAGTDTTTGYEVAASSSTGTLTEALGADGTIASGAESDSLSESSGATTTEIDHPTETVNESASDVTMTLTSTVTNSDTANESDQDWACETLGTSGTIAGGSDCFTVSSLETSGYTSNGSGPEDYNDTSSTPDGTAKVTGSGSSSNFTYQKFGDVLGSGGDIASGSLTYTVTSSETDVATTTETGTETIADELAGGTSQTASYSVTTMMPDSASDWETGTETLGGGGTISTGTASFSWSVGDSLSRNLAVNGIAAILDITENSTDTYGFGESGTETITTGGADAPGTVSFLWNQMGTDYYQIHQANSFTSQSSTPTYTSSTWASYTLNLTATASSSWHDAGADELTEGGAIMGESDTYQWGQLNTLTDNVTDSDSVLSTLSGEPIRWGTGSWAGGGVQSFSVFDTGFETLEADQDDSASLTQTSEKDTDSLWVSISLGYGAGGPGGFVSSGLTSSLSESYDEGDWFSLSELRTSSDGESGTSSWRGDNYLESTTESEWGSLGADSARLSGRLPARSVAHRNWQRHVRGNDGSRFGGWRLRFMVPGRHVVDHGRLGHDQRRELQF